MVWVNTVFAYFKTIPSLYLLYIFSWGITAVVEIIYWVHVYRNTKMDKNPGHMCFKGSTYARESFVWNC